MTVAPASGSRTTFFAIRRACSSSLGYNEQVAIKTPASLADFVFGTPASNATMRAVDWATRSACTSSGELFRGSNPAVSGGWSPIAKVSVH